jgi:ATP-dependent DNA helicase RecG
MIDIESILKLGETQSVEFKKSMSQMKEGCKSLCGMLNTAEGSGMVIYGISPNNKIVGLRKEMGVRS